MATDLHKRLERYFRQCAVEDIMAVYLFGSRGRGTAARESDVDIGIVLDPARRLDVASRFDIRVRLTGELIHALQENQVDVVLLNESPPPLAARIIREGICVYSRNRERLREFERDAQLRAGDLLPFLRRMRQAQLERLSR